MSELTTTLKKYWYIACRSKELKKKPLALTLLNTPIVLFRTNDKVACLIDRCAHRNMPLSKGTVKHNCLRCPYHGWTFNTDGQCEQIPGLTQPRDLSRYTIPSFHAIEKNGFIWVNLTNSEAKIHELPFSTDKYYQFVWKTEAYGLLINILENFLDATHTHYVHSGLIRSKQKRQQVSVEITRSTQGVAVTYSNEGKQSGLISKLLERNRHKSIGRYILPTVAEIEYQSLEGIELVISAFITPVTEHRHTIHAVISIRRTRIPGIIKRLIVTPFFKMALKQDQHVLKEQALNIQRFDTEQFKHTELDIIRPHILALLCNNVQKTYHQTLEILI